MALEALVGIPYHRETGPVEHHLLEGEIPRANCQLATQLYLEKTRGFKLPPDAFLSSNAYNFTGNTYAEEFREQFRDPVFLSSILEPGQLVCAAGKRYAPETPPFQLLTHFSDLDRLIHLAVVVGNRNSSDMRTQFPSIRDGIAPSDEDIRIFHASHKMGKGVGVWPLRDFMENYWVVRLKNLSRQPQQF